MKDSYSVFQNPPSTGTAEFTEQLRTRPIVRNMFLRLSFDYFEGTFGNLRGDPECGPSPFLWGPVSIHVGR